MSVVETSVELKDSQVYINTYVRIESGYMGDGWDSKRDSFFEEVTSIFSNLGFIVNPPSISGACPEVERGAEHLYCHPQCLSGYVTESTIEEVTRAIEGARTFKLRWVDKYESVLNYTEDEFTEELEQKREELIGKILERFKTKRRNLYMSIDALDGVHSGIPYFQRGVRNPLLGVESRFISALFGELVEKKMILTASKGERTIYRSRTKRDVQV